MANPGSGLLDFGRFVARGLFTANQRKKIKAALVSAAELPLRLTGLQRLLDGQRAEMDRLKSRLVVLDGKLNLALFGMPVLDEYRPYLLSNSLVKQLDEKIGEAQLLVELDRILSDVQKVNVSTIHDLAMRASGIQPCEALIVGLDLPDLPMAIRAAFPSLQSSVVCDVNPLLLKRFTKGSPADIPIETIPTDPLTMLISQNQRKFDLIIAFHRLHQMSPRDQVHFMLLAVQALRPGGVLYIEIPDPANADVYWADYRNLRPISLSFAKSVLRGQAGELSVGLIGGDGNVRHWGLTFRKT
jgi:hypothetical protein